MDASDKNITILAVDDDPMVLKLVEASLMKENYKLVFAPDGETGLRLAHEVHPDLIILDVVMPGIDGFEFCSIVRKDPALNDIPIIMLTALDDRDSKVQGLESGADDYLCKPFDKIEFRARIRTITRLKQIQKQAITELKQIIEEKEKTIEMLKKELDLAKK